MKKVTAIYFSQTRGTKKYVEAVAKELKIPVFAKLPIEPEKAAAADAGTFYDVDHSVFSAAVETLQKPMP